MEGIPFTRGSSWSFLHQENPYQAFIDINLHSTAQSHRWNVCPRFFVSLCLYVFIECKDFGPFIYKETYWNAHDIMQGNSHQCIGIAGSTKNGFLEYGSNIRAEDCKTTTLLCSLDCTSLQIDFFVAKSASFWIVLVLELIAGRISICARWKFSMGL